MAIQITYNAGYKINGNVTQNDTILKSRGGFD
jgi:hypothetical protein